VPFNLRRSWAGMLFLVLFGTLLLGSLGHAQQSTCTPGQIWDGSTCERCLPGTYADLEFEGCLPCPSGTFSSNTTLYGNAFCTNASIGYNTSSDQTSEVPCAQGYYAPISGLAECLPAPAGGFVAYEGLSSYQECQPGTFQNQTAQEECMDCTPGGYCDSSGCTECTPAPAGGFVPNWLSESFQLCIAGTYQNLTGQSSCLDCAAGTFCNHTNCTECESPPPGFIVPPGNESYNPTQCNFGKFSFNASMCVCADIDHYTVPGRATQLPCQDNYHQPEPCKEDCVEKKHSECEYCAIVIPIVCVLFLFLVTVACCYKKGMRVNANMKTDDGFIPPDTNRFSALLTMYDDGESDTDI
jgi:hypothetical protein